MKHKQNRLPVATAAAHRALLDCRIIRVVFDHPGYVDLYERGLADISLVAGNEDALDYRLARAPAAVGAAAA